MICRAPPAAKSPVAQCGQVVRDHREVERDGRILCKPCAGGAYFTEAREITFPEMNWSPYTSNPEAPDTMSAKPFPATAEGREMRKAP